MSEKTYTETEVKQMFYDLVEWLGDTSYISYICNRYDGDEKTTLNDAIKGVMEVINKEIDYRAKNKCFGSHD